MNKKNIKKELEKRKNELKKVKSKEYKSMLNIYIEILEKDLKNGIK